MAKAAIIRLSDYRQQTEGDDTSKKVDDQIKKSNELTQKSLTTTQMLNMNIVKLAETIKKSNQLGGISDKAKSVQGFMGGRGAIGEKIDAFKDFFTLRGFLDKTGMVERGKGGIIDKTLEKREAKQDYVKTMMKTDPTVNLLGKDKAKEVFKERFEKSNTEIIKIQKNEKEIERMRTMGLTEDQIKRSPEMKKKAELEAGLAKVDPRFRNIITGGKDSKSDSGKKAFESTKASELADAVSTSEEEVENARKMDEQTAYLKEIAENTRPVGPKGKEEEKEKGGLLDKISDFLTKKAFGWVGRLVMSIGRGIMGIGKFVVAGLMKLGPIIGNALMGAARFLLNPATLLKFFTKVLPIAAIIGSIASGLFAGFKEFSESGDIGKALIAGLGGILEFLTFGLIGKEQVQALVDWVSGFVNDYIIEPISEFFAFMGDIFKDYVMEPLKSAFETVFGLVDTYILDPIAEFFKPLTDFVRNLSESVLGWFRDFEIPEIGFEAFGKKIAIGPWYPFRPDQETALDVSGGDTSGAPAQPAGSTAAATPAATTSVVSKSTGPIDLAKDGDTLNKYAMEEAKKFGRDKPSLEDKKAAMTRLRIEKARGTPQVEKVVTPNKKAEAAAAPQVEKASDSRTPLLSKTAIDTAKDGDTLNKYAMEEAKRFGRSTPSVEDKKAAMTRLRSEKAKGTDVEAKGYPQKAGAVDTASKDVARGAPMQNNNQTVVNAPTTNNTKVSNTYVPSPSPRNSDATMNNYLRTRAVG